MALINCKECGKEISDQAITCPNCGCPNEKEEKKLCMECGNELNPNDIECLNCGCPLQLSDYNFNGNKTKKINKPIIISGVLILLFVILYSVYSSKNSITGTYIQEGGVGTTIIFKKDNTCSMSVQIQDDDFPSTIYNCHWSISNKQITINYTMSMSGAYGINYTRDGSLSGTLHNGYIEMDAGAIYYKK